MRKEFELTDEQFQKIIEASKPTPAMWLSGGQPMFDSPQENANRAWKEIGAEMGFDYMTAAPIPGRSQKCFTAEVVEMAQVTNGPKQ